MLMDPNLLTHSPIIGQYCSNTDNTIISITSASKADKANTARLSHELCIGSGYKQFLLFNLGAANRKLMGPWVRVGGWPRSWRTEWMRGDFSKINTGICPGWAVYWFPSVTNYPKFGGLKTEDIYSLTVLEPKSPKSKYRGCSVGESALCPSLASTHDSWPSWACCCITPVPASVVSWPPPGASSAQVFLCKDSRRCVWSPP